MLVAVRVRMWFFAVVRMCVRVVVSRHALHAASLVGKNARQVLELKRGVVYSELAKNFL